MSIATTLDILRTATITMRNLGCFGPSYAVSKDSDFLCENFLTVYPFCATYPLFDVTQHAISVSLPSVGPVHRVCLLSFFFLMLVNSSCTVSIVLFEELGTLLSHWGDSYLPRFSVMFFGTLSCLRAPDPPKAYFGMRMKHGAD